MKNFIKVIFCLLLLMGYISPGTQAQDKKDISTGYLVPVHDSLVIDKQKIKSFEKELEDRLPKEIHPKVKIHDNSENYSKNSDGDEEVDVVTRTIYAHALITELGINRFIATQSFPPLTGTFPGTNITYTVSISRPYVTLRQNSFRANFTIYVTTSENNNYVIPVNPNLRLDPQFVTLSEIKAFLENFPALIQALSIPQMIKDMIIERYNSLNLVIYPNKILEAANQLVPSYFNIVITDIGGGYQILDRKLRLNFSVTVNSEPPHFIVQRNTSNDGIVRFRILSNIRTKLFKVHIGDANGPGEEVEFTYDEWIDKNIWSREINTGHFIAPGTYYFRIIFKSDFGEYGRQYQLTRASDWWGMALTGSLN